MSRFRLATLALLLLGALPHLPWAQPAATPDAAAPLTAPAATAPADLPAPAQAVAAPTPPDPAPAATAATQPAPPTPEPVALTSPPAAPTETAAAPQPVEATASATPTTVAVPTGPVDATASGTPATVAAPAGPTAPADAAASGMPATATAPTGPSAPADTAANGTPATAPTGLAAPADAAASGTPATATAPTGPTAPADTAASGAPATAPTGPTTPADPAIAVIPATTPVSPGGTTAPATAPTTPVTPAAATGTATPTTPPQQVVVEEPPRPPQDPNLPIGMDQTACPYLSGPFAQGQVSNPSEAWNGTDTGVVVNGHVALRGADGRPLRTLLGVDLSSHNRPDYRLLARCGTAFSFVRMDDKYNTHAAELDRLNVRPLPYYFFGVPASLRDPSRYANLSDTPASQAAIDSNLATFQKLGEDGVQSFLDRMRRLNMREMPVVTVRNPDLSVRSQARVLAVDIEQKLEPEPNNDTARIYYGRFYAKAVCAWVKGVQDALPGTLVLMYTTPSVWGEYLYAAYPQEAACLNAMPIWVARTTVDGGDVIRSSRSKIDLYTARLCTASGSNRCVVHQYSHRGLLGLAPPLERGRATHFDLNRFFLVQPVQTGAGIMFVREQ